MRLLEDKVAIVTGGAQGIGRAVVEACAREGARVTILDRDATGGAAVVRDLGPAGARVTFLAADVTREADVESACAGVLAREGAIDILVNNAGVNAYFDAAAMTEAQWDSVFAVDLKGAWLCTKHVLPAMKTQRRGSIVNIASIHATLTISGMFPYAAAKSGLVGMTRSLALEYAPKGIRVNAVLPGYTRTRLVEEWMATQPDPAEAERRTLRNHP